MYWRPGQRAGRWGWEGVRRPRDPGGDAVGEGVELLALAHAVELMEGLRGFDRGLDAPAIGEEVDSAELETG